MYRVGAPSKPEPWIGEVTAVKSQTLAIVYMEPALQKAKKKGKKPSDINTGEWVKSLESVNSSSLWTAEIQKSWVLHILGWRGNFMSEQLWKTLKALVQEQYTGQGSESEDDEQSQQDSDNSEQEEESEDESADE